MVVAELGNGRPVPRAFSFPRSRPAEPRRVWLGTLPAGDPSGPLLYFRHAIPRRWVSVLRRPVLWLTGQQWVRTLTVGHPLGKRVAARFVAGETLEQGIHAAEQLNALGIGAMLNHLGESVTSAETVAAAHGSYCRH